MRLLRGDVFTQDWAEAGKLGLKPAPGELTTFVADWYRLLQCRAGGGRAIIFAVAPCKQRGDALKTAPDS